MFLIRSKNFKICGWLSLLAFFWRDVKIAARTKLNRLEESNGQSAKRDGASPEEVRDLRGAIEWMKKEGDIMITDKEVDPNLEITGIQKQLDGGCPILFNNVKGKPQHRCITNLFGDMNVINKMFGWKDHADRTRKLAYAITHPIPPIVVDQKDAPVQEEVYEKPAEANDFVVPIRHTDIEPELTVGSGNRLISGEYFNGGTDLGYNRMNFRWGNVGTFQISPGSHMWQVVSKYYKDNKTGADHDELRIAALRDRCSPAPVSIM